MIEINKNDESILVAQDSRFTEMFTVTSAIQQINVR
jgi:hypothetical protein